MDYYCIVLGLICYLEEIPICQDIGTWGDGRVCYYEETFEKNKNMEFYCLKFSYTVMLK